MYDSLNLEDFRHILYIIRDNHEKQHDWLTHKEIRVYLHCLRELWTEWTEFTMPHSYLLVNLWLNFYLVT
ncbi:hypothetical protein JYQ62_32010 [Nostoc sp. UHCC 0702]|nr:hypothetical protein JYQ62_32010 [Nostoc sp. UHCC 0702]